MEDNWFNVDPNDNFNPEDHGIEMDDIAKMYAMNDMRDSNYEWAKNKANIFYKDFENLNISKSITAVKALISLNEIQLEEVNIMLDNMIQLFQDSEEYEKCHKCLQIKHGINDKI